MLPLLRCCLCRHQRLLPLLPPPRVVELPMPPLLLAGGSPHGTDRELPLLQPRRLPVSAGWVPQGDSALRQFAWPRCRAVCSPSYALARPQPSTDVCACRRELVSNASDALDKIRLLAVQNGDEYKTGTGARGAAPTSPLPPAAALPSAGSILHRCFGGCSKGCAAAASRCHVPSTCMWVLRAKQASNATANNPIKSIDHPNHQINQSINHSLTA